VSGAASSRRFGLHDLIVHHADDVKADAPVLRIAELIWTPDGWPAAIT